MAVLALYNRLSDYLLPESLLTYFMVILKSYDCMLLSLTYAIESILGVTCAQQEGGVF